MKSITSRAVIILLSVLSIALAGLLILETFEVTETPDELNELQRINHSQTMLLESYRALIATDEPLLYTNDWEGLRSILNQQLTSASDELRAAIQLRITHVDQKLDDLQSENIEATEFARIIRSQRIQIDQMQLVLDSANTVFLYQRDSLASIVASLRSELNDKRAELKRKEKVMVISFPGVKGSTIHYMGEVENGKANGGGIGIWTTGSVYRGEWKDNLRHGKGTFEWADGERYEGDYVEGRREGDGVYYWPSGERYEGQWKNDRRTGSGILYDLDGNIRYDGMWKDDKPLSK